MNVFETFNLYVDIKHNKALQEMAHKIRQHFIEISGIPADIMNGAFTESYLKSMQERWRFERL